jgi:hypothetical protein
LWSVNVEDLSVVPTSTSLPGNHTAVHQVWVRGGWLAVGTHEDLWSVPLSLDGPGRRLRSSFTMVPHADGSSMWVQRDHHEFGSGRYVAVDRSGDVTDELVLDHDEHLRGVIVDGFVVELPDGSVTIQSGTSRQSTGLDGFVVVARHHLIAAGESQVELYGLDSAERIIADLPGLSDLDLMMMSVSPNGRSVALSARCPGSTGSSVNGQSELDRPSKLAIVDLVSGEVRVPQIVFDNFAMIAWSADSTHVVFSTPFKPRRFYRVRVEDLDCEMFDFQSSTVGPMLDMSALR